MLSTDLVGDKCGQKSLIYCQMLTQCLTPTPITPRTYTFLWTSGLVASYKALPLL